MNGTAVINNSRRESVIEINIQIWRCDAIKLRDSSLYFSNKVGVAMIFCLLGTSNQVPIEILRSISFLSDVGVGSS